MNSLENIIELHENEHVLALLRRHWIVFASQVALLAVMFFVPFVLGALPFSIPFIAPGTTTFFGAVWMLLVFMYAYKLWICYYFDVWIVTNHRLVDVEQRNLFNRKSSTLELEHIEDITVHVEGLTRSMIGFGTLSVQTAARNQEFLIDDIKDPESAKQIIYTAQRETRHHEINRSEFNHNNELV